VRTPVFAGRRARRAREPAREVKRVVDADGRTDDRDRTVRRGQEPSCFPHAQCIPVRMRRHAGVRFELAQADNGRKTDACGDVAERDRFEGVTFDETLRAFRAQPAAARGALAVLRSCRDRIERLKDTRIECLEIAG
jgi:hypothetical protein